MATASSNSQTKQYSSLPPKRGHVKAQIFESISEAVSSMASKAGEALGKLTGVASVGGSGSNIRNGTATPRPSSYTSDDSSDHISA